ncbi:hypothetical protein BS47DRAFT_262043 [Hydnum rufescens UP504]|uniref:Secreted protein n=1 Tax=Hydnum rufescens UP504 TaxID=1448309 RepID=A0A9P6B774_9AGAM|nr:hypothetical protein BS47DRAFT_262043 [Hydnum rufescens UP504]
MRSTALLFVSALCAAVHCSPTLARELSVLSYEPCRRTPVAVHRSWAPTVYTCRTTKRTIPSTARTTPRERNDLVKSRGSRWRHANRAVPQAAAGNMPTLRISWLPRTGWRGTSMRGTRTSDTASFTKRTTRMLSDVTMVKGRRIPVVSTRAISRAWTGRADLARQVGIVTMRRRAPMAGMWIRSVAK